MEFEESVMDCNIPELLARDLEMSQSIFTSKQMTAGLPSLEPFFRESFDRCQSLGGDVGRPGRRLPSQRPLARVRSIGALGQHYPKANNDEDAPRFGSVSTSKRDSWGFSSGSPESLGDGEASSDDVSESSVDVEPPPFRHREYSVTTPATSVASARCSFSLSHKPVVPVVNDHSGSWLDFEPEIVIPSDRRRSIEMDSSMPRPQTSSGLSAKEINRLSQSSARSIQVPQRRSSLSHQVTIFSDDGSQICPPDEEIFSDEMKEQDIPSSQTHPQIRSSVASSGDHMANVKVVRVQSPPQKPVIIKVSRPSQDSERAALSLLDDQVHADSRYGGRSASLTTSRSYHTKPHAAIQSWLDSSTDSPLVTPMVSDDVESDDVGRGVPIPLQVVDSLQTSIRGFPDTLLTTSSLSIETIRSYSRKLKIPNGADSSGAQAFPILPISSTVPSMASTSRRFKLSKILTSRKALSEAKASLLGRGGHTRSKPNPFHRASFASTVPTAAFARLKCIFPNGADYLCDALYAHLLAYNYICSAAAANGPSFLAIPDCPTRPATATLQPPPSRKSDDGRHIPKKAAQFLGISSGSASDYFAEAVEEEFSPRTMTLGRKSERAFATAGVPRSATAGSQTRRPFGGGSGGAADAATAQELLEGLTGCIGRLVATLKVPVGRFGEEPELSAEGPRDVDALFLNALCEIVRCCEDMN